MSSTVRLRWMSSPSLFAENYGIDEESLRNACDHDKTFLQNLKLAQEDEMNPVYLTKEERVLNVFREVAKENNNTNAMDEYKKPRVYFGVIETMMGRLGYASPVFMNFTSYRTWSRWSKILFLAPVPDLDNLFESDEGGNSVLSSYLGVIEPTKDRNFANYFPHEDGVSKVSLLFRHIRQVLKHDFIRGVDNSLRSGQSYRCFRVIFHVLDTFTQAWAYFFQLFLPMFLAFAIFFICYQLHTRKCIGIVSFLTTEI